MASFLLDQTLLEAQEVVQYRRHLELAGSRQISLVDLLRKIPRSLSSYGPLATLAALLEAVPGPWPVLELQRTYTALWKLLPEDAKAGHASAAGQQLIDYTLQQCKASYSSLLDLFHPESSAAAIIDPESGRSAYHDKLSAAVRDFRLPLPQPSSGRRKPIVAISLPNGPLLAITVLATATYYTAAPVAHGSGVGKDQFKADVLQSKSNLVLACTADVDRLGLQDAWLRESNIPVLLVDLSEDMSLSLRNLSNEEVGRDTMIKPVPNHADDTGIMLFTSGTSGTKKLVPLRIHSMIAGVAMVAESWGLSESMRCLNQMPLNHVGGLIRNLFAPIFTAGSVICCTAFDANLFWDCVEDYSPTWYYASPSMHQVILEAGDSRPESIARSRIHLICNAAGGLLPSLAIRLRETFSTESVQCTVLPSYGMTECMPISTPPLSYRLEKTGTSGISVGPEIAVLDGRDSPEVPRGEIGRIAVRGPPVFGGYLKDNNVIDKSCFTLDGWFDTGDMGYLDKEGFLYITGRSKEVINRGGELISPFEVEEAILAAASKPESPIYGRISKALAFSVTHDVLQEVVGIAIAVEGAKRPCLRQIQDSVKSVLSQVKVPVLLVYMKGGVPTNNNKVLRIKLAQRLNLPDISDNTPAAGRYFEADCPPPNTPLSEPIESRPLSISHRLVYDACKELVPDYLEYHIKIDDLYPEMILARKNVVSDTPTNGLSRHIMASLSAQLDGYSVPYKVSELDEPLPRTTSGDVDESALEKMLNSRDKPIGPAGDMSQVETTVARVFSQVLSLTESDVGRASDFFELGGDSMGAGRLLNALRKEYPLRLPINLLFTNPKVFQLAMVIEEKLPKSHDIAPENFIVREPDFLPGLDSTCSSTNPILMLIQLLPIVVFIPMRRAASWTAFMYMLTETQRWATNTHLLGRALNLVVSIIIAGTATRLAMPLIAIVFKWVVMGRYKEGLYPMWDFYHTRWWITQKMVQTQGMGLFKHFNWSRVLYWRLLGANIGNNVIIQKGVTSGEWDLIRLDDGVVLEKSTVRPFAAERNTSMYLGRIHIGANALVGLAAIVAAGTTVPAGACIGPNSSSWEVQEAADEANRDLASARIPDAHWVLEWLVGKPLSLCVQFIGAVPWIACIIALVDHQPRKSADMLRTVVIWFASDYRVGLHYAALAANFALGPFFFYMAVVVIKRVLDICAGGKIQPSSVNCRSAWTQFRMQWLRTVMPMAQFHKLSELFGAHYEATSIFARALGARVGKRVYWPGTGPSVQDWDLLDIGNDVVFGSRSHIVTSDGTGSDYVRVGSGAMIADRVVLLPGVEIGGKAVMGSGAMTRRDKHYAPETTWVGSKRGDAVCLTNDTATTSTAVNTGYNTPVEDSGRTSLNYRRASFNRHRSGADVSGFNSTSTTLAFGKTASNSAACSIVPANPSCANVETNFEKPVPADPGPAPVNVYDTDSKSATVGTKDDMSVDIRSLRKSSTNNSTLSSPVDEKQPHHHRQPPIDVESSPFGKAFYEGKANYWVWGQFLIFLYSTTIVVFNGVYWNIASVSSVQIVARFFHDDFWLIDTGVLAYANWYRPLCIYLFFAGLIAAISTLQAIAVVLVIIAAKWVLMGRRQPGNYDWDQSSYCQRWQLFLKLETFRRHCYGGNGILGLLTGTHWIVLYFRALGANIGKDCSLFSGGLPSLMFTEPDLITLGDRVSVDDASVVGHINTRGKFDLNPLSIGARSVLRSGSRLLSGAKMEEDTCLLEHTLVMAGDVVDAGTTSQGWPAEEFSGARMPTLESARYWRVKSV